MASSSPPDGIPPIAVPIIEAYGHSIQPSVAFLMIGTVFSSMLIPLLICVFYFSTAANRRSAIFIIVVLDVVLGIALGIWNGVLEIHAILSPLAPFRQSTFFAFEVVYSSTPWLVDLVLLARLAAVYPPQSQPWMATLAIFSFPIAIKCVRLSMNVAFAVKWHENIANITNPVQAAQRTWAHSPYTKVEWVSQIFDNGYASALFLWKIKGGFHHAASDSGRVTNGSMDSLSGRLRMLFWIALTNFVFPVVFNLVQIIIIFSKNSFFVGAYIMMVNTFVSILGVVFATVWSSSLKARGPTTTFSRSQTGRTLPLIFKHTVTDSDTLGKSRDSSNGFDRTNAKVPSNFDEMPLETIALGKAD